MRCRRLIKGRRCNKLATRKRNTWCRSCDVEYQRMYARTKGRPEKNFQSPGKFHKFPCGCKGILPLEGKSNKFATCRWKTKFQCRVWAIILNSENPSRKRRDYKPIDRDIPHLAIRALMEEKTCERCGLPLKWVLGPNTTPHLHHNHRTGKLFGFTHPQCNSRALEKEIDRLRAMISGL